ncbi:MAG: threonine--tRNA ligase [Thermodesulfobacteriota bacterium]|nr:threonine--tRNA ligase [Thermodesulfobacteriota bacterium]
MSEQTVIVDGKKVSADGSTLGDFIRNRDVIAALVEGQAVDLSTPAEGVFEIQTIKGESDQGLQVIRHSAAHVMAEAVQALFPDARPTIGPATKDGFYYDFDREEPFSSDDIEAIEKKMDELIKADNPFIRSEMTKAEALDFFEGKSEPFKVEIISDLDEERFFLYEQGGFIDLCRGPHIPSTGYIRAFKLLSVAGAYWRGDENNRMLQRIYGTAFGSRKELKKHLNLIEEAKKRDHRRLGRDLELFMVSDEVGPGLVIFLPKGGMLRNLIEEFDRRIHLNAGYDIVYGPNMLRDRAWKISGHMDYYKENMYFTEIDGQTYGIKPMNCISHILIYKSKVRSYRDLPLRYFELGTVARHEKSGVLHGLLRVRQFTQDDAHIFCREDQLLDEITGVMAMIHDVMDVFGFDYAMEISTRPDKSIGTDHDWAMATKALRDALDRKGLCYEINEGDGAFYGPKIDVKIKDAIGREWQCATIQCDFSLPERFDMHYIGSDGDRHRPVMLHRVILGTIERFMGVLIEHYAGAFPVWLAPVQAVIMNITDDQAEYASGVADELKKAGIRIELDLRNEKIGFKIREARLKKVPYMVVIGDRERDDKVITVRGRSGDQEVMDTRGFISAIGDQGPKI